MEKRKRKVRRLVTVSLIGAVLVVAGIVFWPWSTPFAFLKGAQPVAYQVSVLAHHSATTKERLMRIYEVDDSMSDVVSAVRSELSPSQGWTEERLDGSDYVEFVFMRDDGFIVVFPNPTDEDRTAVLLDLPCTASDWVIGFFYDVWPERYNKTY